MKKEKTHHCIKSDRETLLHYISYLYLNFICLEKILSYQNKGEITWLSSGTADKARKMDPFMSDASIITGSFTHETKLHQESQENCAN